MTIITNKRKFLTGTTLALLVTCLAGGVTPSFGMEELDENGEKEFQMLLKETQEKFKELPFLKKNDDENTETKNEEEKEFNKDITSEIEGEFENKEPEGNVVKNFGNKTFLLNSSDDLSEMFNSVNQGKKTNLFQGNPIVKKIENFISDKIKIEEFLTNGLHAKKLYELIEKDLVSSELFETICNDFIDVNSNEKKTYLELKDGQEESLTLKKLFVLRTIESIIADRANVAFKEEMETLKNEKKGFWGRRSDFQWIKTFVGSVKGGWNHYILGTPNHLSLLYSIITFSLDNKLCLTKELFGDENAVFQFDLPSPGNDTEEKKTVENDRDTFINKFFELKSEFLEKTARKKLADLGDKYMLELLGKLK